MVFIINPYRYAIAGVVPTFQDDFSSYADTTAGDAAYPTTNVSRARVNPTNDDIDINCNNTVFDMNIYHDIGTANISNTWLFRCKLNITAFTSCATPGNVTRCIITLNSNHATGEDPVEDALGISIDYFPSNIFMFGYIMNGGSINRVRTSTTVVPSVSTFYLQFARVDVNTFDVKIFSNSDYTTQLGSTVTMTISSAYTGLRYFGIQQFTQITGGQNLVATLDDIKFYDGISSL